MENNLKANQGEVNPLTIEYFPRNEPEATNNDDLVFDFKDPFTSIDTQIIKIGFENSSRAEFIKNMNFLITFQYHYICEVLHVESNLNAFVTHSYKKHSLDELKSLQLRAKLRLISQLLKLAFFFESRHIKNYKLDISSIYFDCENEHGYSVKFYDFSKCEFDRFNQTENTFDSSYLYQSIEALEITKTPSSDQTLVEEIFSMITNKDLKKRLLRKTTLAIIPPLFKSLSDNRIKQSIPLIKNLSKLLKHSKKSLV